MRALVQTHVAELEPGLRVTGHWVSNLGQVGSGHGSIPQRPDLTRLFDPDFLFNIVKHFSAKCTYVQIAESNPESYYNFSLISVVSPWFNESDCLVQTQQYYCCKLAPCSNF